MTAPVQAYAGQSHGIMIPGSGYFIPEEQPELLARALREFIG